ncbi:MAG TPA: DUF4159 domain-containing protein [Bryobacteraceae bacterium]|nr:DUF4159 domain-containing protein [Bryobacteraceae bacterium]
MTAARSVRSILCGFACLGALAAFQRPFRELPGIEYDLGSIPLPPDYRERTEWAFARLMFPPGPLNGYYGRDGDWHTGYSLWSQDFPRADRHFSLAVRRLTRIHVRSVEQLVNLEEGDAYDWPWLYAVQVGEWGLTDSQGQLLREYLLRGGFFMADDFHGDAEWREFESRIKKVLPEYPIKDVPDDDPIFHNVYDLAEKYQIPGEAHLRAGYKTQGGANAKGAHWRAIYDDKGRILVAISYNSDVGDAWEWADEKHYPERFSDLAIRLGVNYIVYAMTH